MEKIKLEMTNACDLNKTNAKAYGSLYEHYLESGKQDSFIVPLVVDDKNKTVLTVNSINACLFAFCVKSGKTWKMELIANATEEAQNTSRVKLCVIAGNIEDTYELIETSKANKKRPSSKITAEKSEAKKSAEQVEKDAEVKKWNVEKTAEIMDVINAKLHPNKDAYKYLEDVIFKILEK